MTKIWLVILILAGQMMADAQSTNPTSTQATTIPITPAVSTARSTPTVVNPLATPPAGEAKKQRDWVDYTSALVLPILVVLATGYITYTVQNAGVNQKYVELSINILSNDRTPPDAPIRQWAYKLLDKYAPIKFADVSPALPTDVLNGLKLQQSNFISVSHANPSVRMEAHSYFVHLTDGWGPYEVVAQSTSIYRCRVSSLRDYQPNQDPKIDAAYGWANGTIEVHIFAEGATIPARKRSFKIDNGAGELTFMMTRGETARIYNPNDFIVGRGNAAFDVIEVSSN
jgi:hypothetical protein